MCSVRRSIEQEVRDNHTQLPRVDVPFTNQKRVAFDATLPIKHAPRMPSAETKRAASRLVRLSRIQQLLLHITPISASL